MSQLLLRHIAIIFVVCLSLSFILFSTSRQSYPHVSSWKPAYTSPQLLQLRQSAEINNSHTKNATKEGLFAENSESHNHSGYKDCDERSADECGSVVGKRVRVNIDQPASNDVDAVKANGSRLVIAAMSHQSSMQSGSCDHCSKTSCWERCNIHTPTTIAGHLNSTSITRNGVRLHVVSIDMLAWLRSTRGMANRYRHKLNAVVNGVRREYDYLTFKGSEYVFICLHDACLDVGEDLAAMLSNNLGTRAIFAGIDLDEKKLKWPCPLRVINLDSSTSADALAMVGQILERATKLVARRNRWICADEENPPNHWRGLTKGRNTAGFYVQEFGFVLCTIAKSGSSMTNALLRRMMHYKNWNQTGTGINHGPSSGLASVGRMHMPDMVEEINANVSIVKGIIVRDPISRLLSGYLDKIRDKHQLFRVSKVASCMKEKRQMRPFHAFARCLMKEHPDPNKLDTHFRLQSAICNSRKTTFDFVGKQGNMLTEMREFGNSLGFWEDYGEKGWGDGSHSFGEKSYQARAHGSAALIWQYYTEDLVKDVYKYYKEDFIRFGFSIEEILATHPSRNVTSLLD